MALDMIIISNWLENLFFTYGPRLFLALVILIIGLKLIAYLGRFMARKMAKKQSDPSLRHFLITFTKIGLKIMLLISIASMVGIATTSFIAVLGAAGLAVGLALQGSLSNFAGGVLILTLKPFVVGDYIVAQGHGGTVKKIDIFNTVLKTPDNVTIVLPNGNLSNESITNYSVEDLRRVDIVYGISYDADIKKAKKILTDIITKHASTLDDPLPFVRVSELADNSVNITIRVWTKKEDYWDVKFDLLESVKHAFDKNKIGIPYPQMDVHVKKV